jgi:16S rRNA (guanine527-N7)-methyltransferase
MMDRDQKLSRFREELLRWTETINLIGPEARRNLDQHVEEALAATKILEPYGEILDFGSGGGLPAIPMAIVCPEARFHLVEADQRKWAFLKHIVRECELNSIVHGDRLRRALEKLDPAVRFTLVTSRAVGKPEEWIPLLSSRLLEGGKVALFGGSPGASPVGGFVRESVHKLPRGEDNYLVSFVRMTT